MGEAAVSAMTSFAAHAVGVAEPPNSPKSPKPPSHQCRQPSILAKSGRGCFRELGHRIFHDFLAAGLPNLPSCRAADSPGRKCWPSQGVDVFEIWATASSMTSFPPGRPSCRAVELPILPGRKCWPSQGRDVFESWATASSMTSLPPGRLSRRASIKQGSRCLPINHIK